MADKTDLGKTISGYQAGERLQFQRDAIPENNARYDLGTQTNPFYALHVRQFPLTNIPAYLPPALTDRPFTPSAATRGTCFFMYNTGLAPARWQLVIQNTNTTFNAFIFSPF